MTHFHIYAIWLSLIFNIYHKLNICHWRPPKLPRDPTTPFTLIDQATLTNDKTDEHLSLMFSSTFSIEPCWRINFKAVCPPIPKKYTHILHKILLQTSSLWQDTKVRANVSAGANIQTHESQMMLVYSTTH